MAVALWVHFGWKTSKSICNYSFFRQSYPFRMKFSLLTYYFIVIFFSLYIFACNWLLCAAAVAAAATASQRFTFGSAFNLELQVESFISNPIFHSWKVSYIFPYTHTCKHNCTHACMWEILLGAAPNFIWVYFMRLFSELSVSAGIWQSAPISSSSASVCVLSTIGRRIYVHVYCWWQPEA